MRPVEFWNLTPAEFILLTEAYEEERKRRQDDSLHMLAWHAANIMNASGNLKRPVSVEKLLGKKTAANKNPTTIDPEEKKKQLQALKEKFGKGG